MQKIIKNPRNDNDYSTHSDRAENKRQMKKLIFIIMKKKPRHEKAEKSDKMKLCIFCQVLKNDKSHESLRVLNC